MLTATGTADAASVIDVFARNIVGWRVPTSMTTSFILDALNPAVCQRLPALGSLIHHSGRGMQYLSIRYAERLVGAGIDLLRKSVGDSCENALAKSVIGLLKTEVVKHLCPSKTTSQLEWEIMKLVTWHNKGLLHGPVGYQTQNEIENTFCQQKNKLEKAA